MSTPRWTWIAILPLLSGTGCGTDTPSSDGTPDEQQDQQDQQDQQNRREQREQQDAGAFPQCQDFQECEPQQCVPPDTQPEDPAVDRCEGDELDSSSAKMPRLSWPAYRSLLMSGMLVKEADVLTVSYNEGYNLNFEISKDQAYSLLPCNLTPMRLKLLESDPEPAYYLVWYMAALDSSNKAVATNRVDLFTYAYDEKGDPGLFFVSSYMGLPEAIRSNKMMLGLFEEIFEFFAVDTKTGDPAYPHYYTNEFTIDRDTFKLVYEDSTIEAAPCDALTTNERFTREVVVANSQIYRTAIDKNVNFFNQDFINARVETRDPKCVTFQNLVGFHPLLSQLKSIHFYGSKDKKITWYYQMCTGTDCGNPFK